VHTGGVNGYVGIAIVVVLGVAVVAYGYLWDRTTNRRHAEAMQAPPDRPIPGFNSQAAAPDYVLPESLDAKPTMDAAELAALRKRLDAAIPLPHGHGQGAFATDYACGLAALNHPLILIVDGDLTSMRELLDVAGKATKSSRPLVVVAERIATEVFQTLEANTLATVLATVAITMPDKARRAHLAELVDASQLPPSDLKMGWVPDAALGTCGLWVSSPTQLWVLDDAQQ
jgi:hypothetical protein